MVMASREIIKFQSSSTDTDNVISVVVFGMKALEAFVQGQVTKAPRAATCMRSDVVLRDAKYEMALQAG
jgi:hypothetical protein